MGLLDAVLGAVTNHAQNNPQILEAAASLLGNDGGTGGLEGLVAKFQQAGLGDVIASWIGSGQNQAISGEQLSQVLGHDTLSNILPGLVDKLTPAGQSPAGGLGNADDLMGALGNLFNR